jgi:hypothetical protein
MPLLPFYWTAKIRFNMGMDYCNDFARRIFAIHELLLLKATTEWR